MHNHEYTNLRASGWDGARTHTHTRPHKFCVVLAVVWVGDV